MAPKNKKQPIQYNKDIAHPYYSIKNYFPIQILLFYTGFFFPYDFQVISIYFVFFPLQNLLMLSRSF
jgi:hypothetical protein